MTVAAATAPAGPKELAAFETDLLAGFVWARAPGEGVSAESASAWRASVSRRFRTYRAKTTFFLPEARVTGLVPA
jgi:hypothetical protein